MLQEGKGRAQALGGLGELLHVPGREGETQAFDGIGELSHGGRIRTNSGFAAASDKGSMPIEYVMLYVDIVKSQQVAMHRYDASDARFRDVGNYAEVNSHVVYTAVHRRGSTLKQAPDLHRRQSLHDVRAFAYADMDAPAEVAAYLGEGAAALASLQTTAPPLMH